MALDTTESFGKIWIKGSDYRHGDWLVPSLFIYVLKFPLFLHLPSVAHVHL